MSDIYSVLIEELCNDPLNIGYNHMSDEEILTSLNTPNRTKIISKFGSFRTLANILDDIEYTTVKTVLTTVATSSEKMADMLKMLILPGDENGAGGGIDIGTAQVRGMVDMLFSPEIAGKIKAYAEVPQSRAEELNIPEVGVGHIASARIQF